MKTNSKIQNRTEGDIEVLEGCIMRKVLTVSFVLLAVMFGVLTMTVCAAFVSCVFASGAAAVASWFDFDSKEV